jgi:hypothetical protein
MGKDLIIREDIKPAIDVRNAVFNPLSNLGTLFERSDTSKFSNPKNIPKNVPNIPSEVTMLPIVFRVCPLTYFKRYGLKNIPHENAKVSPSIFPIIPFP